MANRSLRLGTAVSFEIKFKFAYTFCSVVSWKNVKKPTIINAKKVSSIQHNVAIVGEKWPQMLRRVYEVGK